MYRPFSTGLGVMLLLGGCAAGVTHDYQQQPINLAIATPAKVAVGTLDRRPYVVNGEKAPNFVGLSRGGFGNPFNVTTRSKKPLASDITDSVVAAMKSKGVDAMGVELKPALTLDEAKAAVGAGGAQKSVLFTLLEWKADAMVNVVLNYEFRLQVFDEAGNILTSKQQQGRENLGSADAFSPGGGAQVLPRFSRMMEALFQDSEVVKALQQSVAASAP